MRKFRVEPKQAVTASTAVSESSIRRMLVEYFKANPEELGIIGDAEACPEFNMLIDNEVKLLMPAIMSAPNILNAKNIRIDSDEHDDGPDYNLYVDDEIYGLEMGRDRCYHLWDNRDIESSVVVYSSLEDDDAAYHQMVQDMKSNDAYKHLAEVAKRYGYTLYSANLTRRGDIEFTVEPDDPHAPDIYLGSATVGTYFAKPGDVKVRIATVSQGSLVLDEYATYMKHVQDAFAFGKFLEDWDGFKDLYQIK